MRGSPTSPAAVSGAGVIVGSGRTRGRIWGAAAFMPPLGSPSDPLGAPPLSSWVHTSRSPPARALKEGDVDAGHTASFPSPPPTATQGVPDGPVMAATTPLSWRPAAIMPSTAWDRPSCPWPRSVSVYLLHIKVGVLRFQPV